MAQLSPARRPPAVEGRESAPGGGGAERVGQPVETSSSPVRPAPAMACRGRIASRGSIRLSDIKQRCKNIVWFERLAPALTVTLMMLVAPAADARARALPPVSALVIDADNGNTLYADAPGTVRAPASLTKMMTMYLAFEAMSDGRLKPTNSVAISRTAARQPPSRLGIAAGKALSVRNALGVIAVDSANDVTVALAETLAGSEARFVERMNATAQRLGLSDTHFANATGLKNPGNRTTARDMARLSLALLRRYPSQYRYFSTRKVTWKTRVMRNHNHLLGKVPGVDGIKTGYTVDAGYNLAASAKRDGKRIVVVVLGARSISSRDARVANLIELGFTPPVPRQIAASSGSSQRRSRGSTAPRAVRPQAAKTGTRECRDAKMARSARHCAGKPSPDNVRARR
jgi:D-alanyl-D-alanine carboxypeptidase